MFDSFMNLMQKSNAVMWPILACSIVSLFIIVERLLHYHRCHINLKDFIQGIFNNLKNSNVKETISICDDAPGPVPAIIRSAILRGGQSRNDIESAIEEASLAEIPRLEKNLNLLATIAHIAPLLGLLGTVLGMMSAFHTIEQEGTFVSMQQSNLAMHIKTSLITTAAGLSVAIPSYAFYNLLVTKVEGFVNEMETAASEIIYFLTHNNIDFSKVDAEISGKVNDNEV